MACGAIGQIIKLVALAIMAACIGFYLAPSLASMKNGSFFTADVGQTAQAAGGISTIVALAVFPLLWCMKTWTWLAIIACILAITDVVSYCIWNWKGAAGILCDGAKSAAAEANMTDLANKYIQCDAEWMTWVIWALIGISGSFQLSVAFSAVDCGSSGSGGGGFSLGRRQPPPHPAAAHSLDKRSSTRSRRSRRRQSQMSDEEAQLPLHEDEKGTSDSEEDVVPRPYERRTMRYGGDSDEEEHSMGRGGDRRSVSLASQGGSLSDEEEEVGPRRSGETRRN